MNWKDTLIDFSKVSWAIPEMKNSEDGKVDIILTIPITDLLYGQAKKSFLMGIKEYHDLIMSLGDDKEEAQKKLAEKLKEWGFHPQKDSQ